MSNTSGPIRVLMAVAMNGRAVVVATDSSWIACDVENVSADADDIGLETPTGDAEPGLYLWTGTGRMVPQGAGGEYSHSEPEYAGTFRPIRPDEYAELLAMSPPDPPEAAE